MMAKKYMMICLMLLLIPIGQANTTPSNSDNQAFVLSDLELDFNLTDFLGEIIQTLEDEAQYDGNTLIGWEYRKNGPDNSDERLYSGYQVGMAGIGDFLLSAYLEGITESQELLDDVISYFMNNYEDSLLDDGVYWSRQTTGSNSGWTSQRYGVAGILSFLSRVYTEYTVDTSKLLDIMEEAYAWLMDQEESEGFPMSALGYITSGYEYGAAGIGLSMLDLYEITSDVKYLSDAESVADWIVESGTIVNDTLAIPWTPYGWGTDFATTRITGIGAGTAGIMDYLLELYEVTFDQKYLLAATLIGNDLLVLDQGGYWPDGSVEYITNIGGHNHGLTGYHIGSSGIAIKLLELYDLTQDERYLQAAARAEKFIEANFDNGNINLGIEYSQSSFTGFAKGSAGIAYYYSNLYERYGYSRHLDNIEVIMENIYSNYDNGILVDIKEPILGSSFNIEEGIAGIGVVLLELLDLNSENLDEGYDEYYTNAVANTTIGDLPEPREFNDEFYQTIGGAAAGVIFGITLLILKRKKKLFFKDRSAE